MSTISVPNEPNDAKVDAAEPSDARAQAESSPGEGGSKPHKGKKKHKAHIAHKIAGRIRIKVPSGKSNPEILEIYKKAFSSIHGVLEVKTKPDTGCIVIHYDPKHEKMFHSQFHHCCDKHHVAEAGPRPGDEIEEMAKKIETEAEFLAERSHLVRATVDIFKTVDYQIKMATDNTVDLKIILAGGLAAATFVEIGAEAATPMWVTLALFTVNHFVNLNQNHSPVRVPTNEPITNR